MSAPTFSLTASHLALLRSMYWEWNCMETGAPSVNPKRPYGNSYVWPDVAEVMGWDWPDENSMDCSDFDKAIDIVEARCTAIHREMQTVLEIVSSRAGLASPPGSYTNTAGKYYRPKWEPSPGAHPEPR